MNILVTGSDGFLGKNLIASLSETDKFNPISFLKKNNLTDLKKKILVSDAIVHLAAINRSEVKKDFLKTNFKFTKIICDIVSNSNKKPLIIYASSVHDRELTDYGLSKKKSIIFLKKFSQKKKINTIILRLPRVFGKWSKANYNSFVATLCEYMQNNKKIELVNKNQLLDLCHIDQVIGEILYHLKNNKLKKKFQIINLKNFFTISVLELFQKMKRLKEKDDQLELSELGLANSLDKFLYSTYISFLPINKIKTQLKSIKDKRGSFVEILKTRESGQFSFFTCEPGEVRGEHYHNTKLEKFLVVRGKAEFRMRNLHDSKIIKIAVSDKIPEVITSIPGYIHDIKNVGKEKLVVFVWANENFNKKKHDTYKKKI